MLHDTCIQEQGWKINRENNCSGTPLIRPPSGREKVVV